MPYTDNPEYQKRMARVMALPPDKQAILGFVADQVTGQAAEDEAKKELVLQRMADSKEMNAAQLALGQQRLGLQGSLAGQEMALQRSGLRDDIRSNRGAERLGYVGLGLGGALGVGQMMQEKERAKRLGALADLYKI